MYWVSSFDHTIIYISNSIGCNRTYYGNLGMTYNLELIKPKDERLPFVCELNFTAAGGVHGDIFQVKV